MNRIHYLVALTVLFVLYGIQFRETGFRLPIYYLPDGSIVSVRPADPPLRIQKILEIEGRVPHEAPATFRTDRAVLVYTDTGAAILKPEPVDRLQQFIDFAPIILLSALYLIAGIWFIQFGSDIYLSWFCVLASFFLYSFVAAIAGHGLDLLWQVFGFLLIPAAFNLGLRTTGKEISGTLVIAEALIVLFFALIAYVGSDEVSTFGSLLLIQRAGFYVTIVIVSGLQIENALRGSEDRIEKTKRWFLFSGTLIGLLLPAAAIEFRSGSGLDTLWFAGICASAFPVALVYGTYRIHVVPFQFVLGRSILAGLLTVFFVSLYAIVLLTHSLLLPNQDQNYRWIVHLIFLLTLVFFLDPARQWMSAFIERNIWRLDSRLSESLKRIARIFSETSRIDHASEAFVDEIAATLTVRRCSLLISDRSFPGFRLKEDALIRMPDSSPLWEHIRPERLAVAAYLAYAAGSRGILYRFLIESQFSMAAGVSGDEGPRFQAILDKLLRRRRPVRKKGPYVALLLGFRHDRSSFSLSEVRYIQEAARLARMLVSNFEILLAEVAKRRKMREIMLAGNTQRSVTETWREADIRDLSIGAFSMPALSVTGDYVDLVPISPGKIAFFLGDVSGHGLGTGYLVSAIRAMVRSHVQSGLGLSETMGTLNSFLMDRYRGNEFITLFAFYMDLEKGRLETLNAAHPGPMVYRAATNTIETLRDTQRLPGLLPDPYHTSVLTMRRGDRLFLYSDGVTETFSPASEPFGEARLRAFLYAHLGVNVNEIPDKLKRELTEHRQNPHCSDDTTFVAIEYAPRQRGLFSFLNPDA